MGVLDGLAASTLPEGHQAAGCRIHQDGDAVGWFYFAPDDHAAGVWNLWWIGVAPRHHGRGAGRAMLAYVEKRVTAAGGRLLVVGTIDADALGRGRIFRARPTIRKEKNLYEES